MLTTPETTFYDVVAVRSCIHLPLAVANKELSVRCRVFIGKNGAASPVIDTGSLNVTSYPLVNDAPAGT